MEATMNLQPKVYVGTYKKYNEGSLKGGWITLTDCKNYAAFLTVCRQLHKDERDPELMIQDCSDMPDGLSCMEWLSEEEFNDIIEAVAAESVPEDAPRFQVIDYSEKAIAVVGDTRDIKDKLKALGGRFNPRLSCGAGWVFSKRQRAEVEKLLQGGKVEKSEAKPKADEGAAWEKNLEEYLSTKKDPDYYKKHFIGAVKLNDGYYLLDKPSIDTKFCFADEGEDYEYYKELMASEEKLKAYFLAENLSVIDRDVEELQGSTPMVVTTCWNDGRKNFTPNNCYYYPKDGDEPMTNEQRSEIIKALQWNRSQFEKRLQTYLKRYGVSKLHTWTYWRDA